MDLNLRRAYGDNIYHRAADGAWTQEDSHHSFVGGVCNEKNLKQDTSADYVLWSQNFIYWGRNAISIPQRFDGFGLKKVRSGRSRYSAEFVSEAYDWFCSIAPRGRLGRPIHW
jgi:hypothetical protein